MEEKTQASKAWPENKTSIYQTEQQFKAQGLVQQLTGVGFRLSQSQQTE